MNNEMILNNREQRIDLVLNQAALSARKPLQRLASYYGQVLERRLSIKQTLCLLNAQLAFVMTVFPVDCAVLLRLACGAWLVSALLKCRNEL